MPGLHADRRCPICQKATDKRYRPFCSKRCADVDLGRWLKGVYHISGDVTPPEIQGTEPRIASTEHGERPHNEITPQGRHDDTKV